MPTKRRRRLRQYQAPVSDAVIVLLRTGALSSTRSAEGGDHAGWWEAFDHQGRPDVLRQDWQAVREELLAAWVRTAPGTRPWGWWEFDAPRWRGPYPKRSAGLEWAMREMAEPRRRLGGIGDPAHDYLNYWPEFEAGIPTHWVSEFDEDYYNGRRRDIHGRPIGTEYQDGHFRGVAPRADDPPSFESQAAYLERHGLLLAGERRRLTAGAFAPEVLVLESDAPERQEEGIATR